MTTDVKTSEHTIRQTVNAILYETQHTPVDVLLGQIVVEGEALEVAEEISTSFQAIVRHLADLEAELNTHFNN